MPMSALSEQLSKVRADAAECALVASLTIDPQKKQMYERIANHLTTLADEVAQAVKDRLEAA
jgi:hypothetical protein